MSLKTFGNEILYERKVGIEEQSGWLKSLNPLEYLKRLGDKVGNLTVIIISTVQQGENPVSLPSSVFCCPPFHIAIAAMHEDYA